jgi:acyl-CoA thioesterase-1
MVFRFDYCFVVLIAWVATTQCAIAQNPAFAPIEDNPELPRVLILGDSISIGYTVPLRAELKNEANVHRPPENCESTREGLAKLDKWLGDQKWDVIHFNFGLHDTKYIDENGKRVSPEVGNQKTPIKLYKKNLRKLTRRLKSTGAALIWCATTPIPDGAAGRVAGDAAIYNKAAEKIVKKQKVPINDLYSKVTDQKIQRTNPDNVHFTTKGSKELARFTADAIRDALEGIKEP